MNKKFVPEVLSRPQRQLIPFAELDIGDGIMRTFVNPVLENTVIGSDIPPTDEQKKEIIKSLKIFMGSKDKGQEIEDGEGIYIIRIHSEESKKKGLLKGVDLEGKEFLYELCNHAKWEPRITQCGVTMVKARIVASTQWVLEGDEDVDHNKAKKQYFSSYDAASGVHNLQLLSQESHGKKSSQEKRDHSDTNLSKENKKLRQALKDIQCVVAPKEPNNFLYQKQCPNKIYTLSETKLITEIINENI